MHSYLEQLEGGNKELLATHDGVSVAVRCGENITFMSGWGDDDAHMHLIKTIAPNLKFDLMPDGVRRRDTGSETFWFNYADHSWEVAGTVLPVAGVLRRVTR